MDNLPEREQIFKNDVAKFTNFDNKTREQFVNYWSEPNKSKTKMRWELEKTWDLLRRLHTWNSNDKKWTNGTNKTGTSAARIETARKW